MKRICQMEALIRAMLEEVMDRMRKSIDDGKNSRAGRDIHPVPKVSQRLLIKTFNFIENPEAGDVKIADLSGVRVYKFKVKMDMMLLAYKHDKEANTLILLAYGHMRIFIEI